MKGQTWKSRKLWARSSRLRCPEKVASDQKPPSSNPTRGQTLSCRTRRLSILSKSIRGRKFLTPHRQVTSTSKTTAAMFPDYTICSQTSSNLASSTTSPKLTLWPTFKVFRSSIRDYSAMAANSFSRKTNSRMRKTKFCIFRSQRLLRKYQRASPYNNSSMKS